MGLYGNIIVDPTHQTRRGRPSTAKPSSPSTTSSSKTAASRRSEPTAPPTPPWAASATSCSPAAPPTSTLDAQAGEVVRFFFTNTANTRIFNVVDPRRANEAGRRRQRPLRARGVDRQRAARTLRASRRRRPLRHAAAPSRSSTGPRTAATGSAPSSSPTRPPNDRSTTSSRRCTSTTSSPRERARLDQERTRPPDKTLVFTASMPILYGPAIPAGGIVIRVPDAPGGHQRRTGHLPEVRHEARRRRPNAPTSARCTRTSPAANPAPAPSAA